MSHFFQSPYYFLTCVWSGFLAWSLTFTSELNDPRYLTKRVENVAHFSSTVVDDHTENNLYTYNLDDADNSISDAELLEQLQLSDDEWQQKSEDKYSLSPLELQEYEDNFSQSYDTAIQAADFMQIAAIAPKVQYETLKSCDINRQAVEKLLVKSKETTELLKERNPEDSSLPRKCLTHIMNSFNLSKNSMARCPKGPNSEPARGGSKPCITQNLVNVTYNAYVDVTSCLGFNPKSLLPKLSNESGFLINTLGGGFDAGVGQLTAPAIEETNKYFDKYVSEIQNSPKPSCQRLAKHPELFTKVKHELSNRCGLIAPPMNPLKNILYMGILNRINIDSIRRRFENEDVFAKIEKLGLTQINKDQLIEAIALAGYNAGPGTAFRAIDEYLDKRLKEGKKLKAEDFDFHNPKMAQDIDGKEKTVTQIARSFVSSPLISKKATPADKKIKIQRAKLLPAKIRSSHLLTFPEFIIYQQNNFDENQKVVAKGYRTIGAPGYLSFLAAKDKGLRETFQEAGQDPSYCSNPKFLKIK